MKGIDIRYSEQKIKNLASELKWKGSGTKEVPLIITSEYGLPRKFAFQVNTMFIKIVNCEFDHLFFRKCQNIIIEKTSFKTLGIVSCSNLTVKNCLISKLNTALSYYNTFEECSISKINNLDSENNIFKNCIMDDKALKALRQNLYDPMSFRKFLPFAILFGGLTIFAFIFVSIYNSYLFNMGIILIIGVYLFLIGAYLILKKSVKHSIKTTPNKILSIGYPNGNFSDLPKNNLKKGV
jgi:pilus assembly protein TadC